VSTNKVKQNKANRRAERARAAAKAANNRQQKRKARLAKRATRERSDERNIERTAIPSDARRRGAGVQRAKERLAPVIEKNRALAAAANEKKFGDGTVDVRVVEPAQITMGAPSPETAALLRKQTVAQLKAVCTDNGIEFKAKDTKAVLLGKLGVTD
jgi:hypothetical protein